VTYTGRNKRAANKAKWPNLVYINLDTSETLKILWILEICAPASKTKCSCFAHAHETPTRSLFVCDNRFEQLHSENPSISYSVRCCVSNKQVAYFVCAWRDRKCIGWQIIFSWIYLKIFVKYVINIVFIYFIFIGIFYKKHIPNSSNHNTMNLCKTILNL